MPEQPFVKLNHVPCPCGGNRADFHSCPEQLAEGRDGLADLLAQAGEILPGDDCLCPEFSSHRECRLIEPGWREAP